MRLLRMVVISSGLICIRGGSLQAVGDLLAKVFESGADGRVEDRVADAQDDAAEDVGIDRARQLDLAAGLLADLVADALDRRLVELDGARDLDREQLVLLLPEPS